MKKTWIAGLVVFIGLALLLSAASVGYAKAYGYSGGKFMQFGGKVELRNTQEFDAAGIENMEITYSSENIIFCESNTDKIVIKEYLRNDAETRMKKEGNTLTIEENGRSTLRFITFGWSNGSERIEVYIPNTFKGNIRAAASSGNIETDYSLDLKSFEAKTSSGNISCSSITADRIKAEASSGNISLEYAEGKREIETTSGNIKVQGGAGDTIVKASSGNIVIEEAEGSFSGSATSGNIKAYFAKVENNIEISASSGNIELEIPEDSSFSFESSASSGSIDTDFDEFLSYNKKENRARGSYGNSEKTDITIHTSTTSGNTDVEFR